jgi:hypothetical protein
VIDKAALLALALALLAGGGASWAAPEDAAARDLLAAARADRPGASAALPRRPEAAIRLLAGSERLPVDDLTPLLVQALRQRDSLDGASREALSVLLERPSLPGARTLSHGPLAVHFAPPGSSDAPSYRHVDADGVPRLARVALEGMAAAWAELETLGLLPPRDDGNGVFDLYLVSLRGQVAGYTAPIAAATGEGPGWPAFAVLDVSASLDEERLREIAARLVARASGFAYRPFAPAWWSEPAALWLEERVSGSPSRYEAHVAFRRQRPERGLSSSRLVQARGNLDLLRTLDLAGDGRRVRSVWESAAAHPELSMVEALDLALRGDRPEGRGVERLLSDLEARALAQTERGDGPPLAIAARHETYPVVAIETAPALEPLGSALILFEAEGESGGLRLRIETDETHRFSGELLLRSRRGAGFLRAPLAFDGAGNAEIGVPWSDFDRAVLALHHVDESGPALSFTYTATPESSYPFTLSSLEVRGAGSGRRAIEWETRDERDLFGWLVLRASSPEGPWQSVTPLPLPALGLGEESTAYRVQDDEPLDGGGEIHYRVVGVTVDGLTRSVEAALVEP